MDDGGCRKNEFCFGHIRCEQLMRYPGGDMSLEVRRETWIRDKNLGFDSIELILE